MGAEVCNSRDKRTDCTLRTFNVEFQLPFSTLDQDSSQRAYKDHPEEAGSQRD